MNAIALVRKHELCAPPQLRFRCFTDVFECAVSGSVTAIVLNPLDVVRTRVQVSGKSVTTVIKETLLHDGVKGYGRMIALDVVCYAYVLPLQYAIS